MAQSEANQITASRSVRMPQARPMPVIVLADASASMRQDGKIAALNQAIGDLIDALRDASDATTEFLVAVISFSGASATVHLPVTSPRDAAWTDLEAAGKTPLGEALKLTAEMVAAPAIPERAWYPTLVLVSDGRPTDDWETAWLALSEVPRARKALRLALAIGSDADRDMLTAFIDRPDIRVCEAHEAREIRTFFEWVSRSVVARSMSPNVDRFVPPRYEPTDDDEDF